MKTLNRIIVMSVAILPMAVSAATYYVAPPPTGDDDNAGTSAAPFATIQKALDSLTSANCWKSQIIIAAGTYQIESELKPTSGTFTYTVKSASGDPSDVTIDAQNCRCFNCAGSSGTDGSGITFKGITFINGAASGNGGGVLATAGCAFEDCVFRNCTATGKGGGISANGKLDHISNVLVDGCSATGDGGGMNIPALTASDGMSNCRIYNCRAGNRGGGVFLEGVALSTVSECDISCNTASGSAGAGGIFGKNAAISNCTFTNNVCDYASDVGIGGSAIRLDTFGTIEGCLIKGNSFTYDCSNWAGGGSAVYLANNSSLINSAIIGNSGSRSVGMQWTNIGGVLVSNCLFKSNVARRTDGSGRGGVMELYGLNADSLITDCRFIDNQAAAAAGLMEVSLNSGSGDATLRIRNCLISGNVVTAGSGMIWANSGKSATARRLAVENCTFVSNTIPIGPVIMPYIEGPEWTATNFVSVSGCVVLFNNGKAAFNDNFKTSTNVTYNCTELNGMSAGNIKYDSTKPLFEDMTNGNFRPARGSQLRDIVPAAAWMGDGSRRSTSRDLGTGYEIRPAGTYGVDVVWTDAVPRLYGIAADIGCFEFWLPPGLVIGIE